MDYTIEPKTLTNAFVLPGDVADRYLKIATADQLRVILYLCRHNTQDITPSEIAGVLGINLEQVLDCLDFWVQAGLVRHANVQPKARPISGKAHAGMSHMTREEIAKAGAEDERLTFLMREAQNKFGHLLRQNESELLAWLYCEEGMDVSVILMLISYAVSIGKPSTRFLEKTAVEWLNAGVTDLSGAEEMIAQRTKEELCEKTAACAFGIRDRKLSRQEKTLFALWVNEMGYDRPMLETAYDICVDATGQYNVAYIKGIIERWHKDGIHTLDDLKKTASEKKPVKKPDKYGAYDKDLLKNLLEDDN